MAWKIEIKQALDQLLESKEADKTAVFDADGTLWHDDLGESFFKYQIENKLAPGIKNIPEPWSYYRQFCLRDAAGAYGWLAQINAGLSSDELLDQARNFYNSKFHAKLNQDLKELIQKLLSKNFQVWICTASLKWAIAPALTDLGLGLDFLIAAEVELDKNKRLTKKIVEPLPYRPGKKYWLENMTINRSRLFI